MAKLSEQELRKEISSGAFRTLYVIYGEEKYLVSIYTDRLVAKVTGKNPSGMDTIIFHADSPLEEIFSAADTLPVFSDKKCIVVYDYDINSLSESDIKLFEKLFSDMAETTVLIFSMPTLTYQEKKKSGEKKPDRFRKFLSAAEKTGGVVCFEKLSEMALSRQLVSWAEKRGCRLHPAVASGIVSRTGSDLNALKNEIEKLCAYADGKEITGEMIELLCVKNTEARIYSLTDLISRNNFAGVYQQLQLLYAQNEKPEVILSVLSSAFIDMYRMRAASEAGKTNKDVADDFRYGRRDFLLKNARNNVSAYTTEQLREILEAILQADIKLKSTRTDSRIILETMIARILLIVRGERVK